MSILLVLVVWGLLLLTSGSGVAEAAIWNRFVLSPFVRCSIRLALLRYDVVAFDRYDDFFADDSKMRIAETGGYEGAVGIVEYVKMVSGEFSPYFSEGPFIDRFKYNFAGYDRQTGMCEFLIFAETSHVSKAENTGGKVSFSVAEMSKITLDLGKGVIKYVDVYMPRGFWSIVLKGLQESDNTRNYICGVMQDACTPYLPANSTSDCLAKLGQLPYHTIGEDNILRYEGDSLSCRALHASLASSSVDNAKMHCPHTSFVPVEDPNGVIKCQMNSGYNYTFEELFTTDEINQFTDYMIRLGYDPEKGTDFVLPV